MLWQQALLSRDDSVASTPAVKKRRPTDDSTSLTWIRGTARSTPSASGSATKATTKQCRPTNLHEVLQSPVSAFRLPATISANNVSSSTSASLSSMWSRSFTSSATSATQNALSDEAIAEEELSDEERLGAPQDDDDVLSAGSSKPGRRLWDARTLFPAGVKRWDNTANCQAALSYDCPCQNKCLSKVGDVVQLYEHRRKLRSSCGSGGSDLRDKLRQKLEEHYDDREGKFSQSFVVAGVGGLCERAFAVAAGVSETTFARARSDVTHKRPTHRGRVQERVKRVSYARAQLNAWVRAQRNSMEGDKTSGLKWYTEKVTERQLWMRYLKCCDHAQVSDVQQGPSLCRRSGWLESTAIVCLHAPTVAVLNSSVDFCPLDP